MSLISVRQYGGGGGISGGYGYSGHTGLDHGGFHDHEIQAIRMDVSGDITRAFQEATVYQNEHIFRTEGLLTESCRRVAVLEKIIEDKHSNTTGTTGATTGGGTGTATSATPGASAPPARQSVDDAEVQTDGDASALLLVIPSPTVHSNSGRNGKNASPATVADADSTKNAAATAAAASGGLVLLKAQDSGEELAALSRATMVSHLKIVSGSQKRVANMAEKLATAREAAAAAEARNEILVRMLELQASEHARQKADADAARKKQAEDTDVARQKQAAADADAAYKTQESEAHAAVEKLAATLDASLKIQATEADAAARKKQAAEAYLSLIHI